jgi:hypothetical protein
LETLVSVGYLYVGHPFFRRMKMELREAISEAHDSVILSTTVESWVI